MHLPQDKITSDKYLSLLSNLMADLYSTPLHGSVNCLASDCCATNWREGGGSDQTNQIT